MLEIVLITVEIERRGFIYRYYYDEITLFGQTIAVRLVKSEEIILLGPPE